MASLSPCLECNKENIIKHGRTWGLAWEGGWWLVAAAQKCSHPLKATTETITSGRLPALLIHDEDRRPLWQMMKAMHDAILAMPVNSSATMHRGGKNHHSPYLHVFWSNSSISDDDKLYNLGLIIFYFFHSKRKSLKTTFGSHSAEYGTHITGKSKKSTYLCITNT